MSDSVRITLPRRPAGVSVASGAAGASQASDVPDDALRRELRQQLDAEVEKLRTAQGALNAAAAELQKTRADVRAAAERQLLDLAMEIARKVLMQEIQAGRYEIDPIAREALSRVPDRTPAEVHLNPGDLERCGGIATRDDAECPVRLVGDANVSPGECLVVTDDGTVESTIEGHLGEIDQALTAE